MEATVRTTLALDDDLVAEAQRLTGTTEKTALVRQALRALIEHERARSGSRNWREVSPTRSRFRGGRRCLRDPRRHVDLGRPPP